MWVMTSFGILMPAIRPPKTVNPGDERTLQIRARRTGDLDILRARYMPTTLGPTIETPKMDYECRAYCTPHAFALALAAISLEIDYTKFKPTTEDKFGDRELHDCYNAIWSAVMGGLSTAKHRYTYWGGYQGTNGHTGAAGRDWVGLSGSQFALPGGDAGDWPHSTSADRDKYEPEGHVDDPWDDYVAAGAGLDGLYQEMEHLLDEQDAGTHIDHSTCPHGTGAAAKARCRRRKKVADRRRIQEIRTLLGESYADATEHLAAEKALTGEVVE